jgi:drug/metabolite transporter (DMT)-like permease
VGISCCLFRQRLTTYTWIACLLALLGALVLWSAATMQWQGDVLAFLGGTHFLVYAFLVEHLLPQEPRERSRMLWPLFGVQFLTMSIVTTILALAFGRWQSLQALVPGTDPTVMVYAGLGTVAVPVLLSTLLIRSAGALTAAFFAVLEPLASGLFAYVVAGERLPLLVYAGSSCILLSMLLQAMGTMSKQASETSAASPCPNA